MTLKVALCNQLVRHTARKCDLIRSLTAVGSAIMILYESSFLDLTLSRQ